MRPVLLELDETAAAEAALRFVGGIDGGLDGPQRRALSKLALARELAVSPRARVVTLEGEVRGVEEDELELANGDRLPLSSLLTVAGNATLDPVRGEWFRGRVRLTIEVLA